jgi:thioredoxin 1
MSITTITKSNIAEMIESGVALIDFWAPWCGPCRALTPIIEEIDKEIGNKITVGKINCDEEPDLAQQYEIRGIPAVFILKNGAVEEILVGVKPKKEYLDAIGRALA